MTGRNIRYCFLILLGLPLTAAGQKASNDRAMQRLAAGLQHIDNVYYRYTMDVVFPNGDKDHLAGTTFLSKDDKRYYNDCSAFTMIYSSRWFYKADHRNKTLEIIDLDKEDNKKLKKERERRIFENGTLTTFLDSFLLKKGIVEKIGYVGDTCNISIGFLKPELIRKMTIAYDTLNDLLVRCSVTISEPWERTDQGVRSMEVRTEIGSFKKVTDKSIYDEAFFFSYKNKELELKRYNDYKLIKKI